MVWSISASEAVSTAECIERSGSETSALGMPSRNEADPSVLLAAFVYLNSFPE